jgi:hypothetical protein
MRLASSQDESFKEKSGGCVPGTYHDAGWLFLKRNRIDVVMQNLPLPLDPIG